MIENINKFEAVINNEMYYEDLIWMSYRYCIGRKTIAAHSHAGNIARYSFNHLSEDRKKFMAHDIRREINDVLHFRDNVSVLDYRQHLPEDAFSIIISDTIDRKGEILPEGYDFDEYNYKIDNGIINVERNEKVSKPYSSKLVHEASDLLPWIKLANALDKTCHRKITVSIDNKVIEYECFPFPYVQYNGEKIGMKWCPIERYLANPIVDCYIDGDIIVKNESYED